MPKRKALLEFKNITVIKSSRIIIDKMTLSIAEGEDVAIIGPNGSGKSTLIRLITREYYPVADDRSVFRIWGENNWDISTLRGLLGIVTAEDQLPYYTGVTCRDAILSGFFSSAGIYSHHIVLPEMEKKTDGMLEFMELAHLSGRMMDEISSGEARRVLIGRALVHKPKALILDEPTNSLDFRAVKEFREVMRRISKSGTGIIIATHTLQDIIPEMKRIVMIKQGKIFKDGAKADVLTGKVLSQLFQIPIDLKEKDGYYYIEE
jgi:iron complex transport system ATP-binding protein